MLDIYQYAWPAAHSPDDLEGACRFRVVTVIEAVERVIAGQWDMPEFQRDFVWKPAQVCALADSLWRNYPIGPLLLWEGRKVGSSEPPLWIADGQQRLTTLCLLYGCEPSWFRRKPEPFRARVHRRFDIRFDVSAPNGRRFVAADQWRANSDPRLLPTSRLMAIDAATRSGEHELERLVGELKDAGCCPELDAEEIYRRLARVSMIRHRGIVATVVNHRQREEVLEIFARLNSRGMRFRRLLLKLAMEEIPAAIRGMRGRSQL
jgi:hypothetical protein